jgi:hypothetical protein
MSHFVYQHILQWVSAMPNINPSIPFIYVPRGKIHQTNPVTEVLVRPIIDVNHYPRNVGRQAAVEVSYVERLEEFLKLLRLHRWIAEMRRLCDAGAPVAPADLNGYESPLQLELQLCQVFDSETVLEKY